MSMVINLDDYVSAPEAAEILGLKYPALWARIDRGQIATIKVGRFHLIKKSSIDQMEILSHDNTTNLDEAAG